MILAAGNLGDFAQIVLYYVWYGIVVGVASLTVCEECLWVLGCTTCYRTLRREGAVAEVLHIGLVNQRTDVLNVHDLYLVILVRGTETIKEIDERNVGLQRCQMRNGCKVHNLLDRARAEHCETCLTASVNVLMVAEDTQRVRGQRTCRHVEHARQQLTGNLVHVRNHEQQSL